MSLMPKLFTTLLLCTNLSAATDGEVIQFLKKGIGGNPAISNLVIKINGKQNIPSMIGWEAYFVAIDADVKQGSTTQHINQNGTYFVNGDVIAPELVNLKTGERLNDTITPRLNPALYTKANLVSGNVNAKNKVAIFSDPLCPFCRKYVPEALSYMMKHPNDFAVYYYHFPLSGLHPAAVALTKYAIAAEQSGLDNVTLRMYQVEINANEKDEQKIADAFNKVFKTKLSPSDIKRTAVIKQYEFDQKAVQSSMVAGTPTVFFNGIKDTTKAKYKEVKVK